jgi:hypothetical protein
VTNKELRTPVGVRTHKDSFAAGFQVRIKSPILIYGDDNFWLVEYLAAIAGDIFQLVSFVF